VKNIMLLFLSDLHLYKDTLEPIDTKYVLPDSTVFHCVQTNESAVLYLNHILKKRQQFLDAIFIFSTNLVKQPIVIRNADGTEQQFERQQDFFIQRITGQLGDLKNRIYTVDYNDVAETGDTGSADADEGIRQIASMAECIKKYARSNVREEIYLHADMTGGFRYASMMMLSVIQLLKFSGIHVGKIVYSDFKQGKIIDVSEVQRMFTLVSGAEEFVNFGSVKAIDSYFGEILPREKQSEFLRNLLDAMRSFSDAIRICKVGAIEKELRVLRKRISAFQHSRDKCLQEVLFAQILDTVYQEYEPLISSRATRFDIILWCVKKELLQQAMTLCNEWTPIYIVDNEICYPNQRGYYGQGHSSWQQGFLTENSRNLSKHQNRFSQKRIDQVQPLALSTKKKNKAFREKIEGILLEIDGIVDLRQQISNWSVDTGRFADVVDTLGKIDGIIKEYSEHVHSDDKEEIQEAFWRDKQEARELLNYFYNAMPPTYQQSFYSFMKHTISCRKMIHQISSAPIDEILKLMKMPFPSDAVLQKWYAEIAVDDVKEHAVVSRPGPKTIFDLHIVRTQYSHEYAMEVLEHYDAIRVQRNRMNHADKRQVKSNQEIADMIREYIDLLQHKKQAE